MARNCWVAPAMIVGFAGVTEIDESVGTVPGGRVWLTVVVPANTGTFQNACWTKPPVSVNTRNLVATSPRPESWVLRVPVPESNTAEVILVSCFARRYSHA